MSVVAERAVAAMAIARGISDRDVQIVRDVYGRYLELPMDFDQRYEDELGTVRVAITSDGRAALRESA